MKENQKLTFKILFMSVIVLSCTDDNVRQINYSNETITSMKRRNKIDVIESEMFAC